MSRDGTIRRTQEGYEIVFERRPSHPPHGVWAMVTEPAHIRNWYTRIDIEPRVGGKVTEHHDHVNWSQTGRVTRFEAPRLFETSWGDEGGPDAYMLRWEVIPDGASTRLRLTQTVKRLEGVHQAMAGWHICIQVLGDLLDGVVAGASAPPQGTLLDGVFVQTTPGRGRWTQRESLESEYEAYAAEIQAKAEA